MSVHDQDEVVRFAEMLASMGAEPRLRIVRLLLREHPRGMTAGDIGEALRISPSTLSHHLDRLKREKLVGVQREGTYLRYTVVMPSLLALLQFLHAECCAGGCRVSLNVGDAEDGTVRLTPRDDT